MVGFSLSPSRKNFISPSPHHPFGELRPRYKRANIFPPAFNAVQNHVFGMLSRRQASSPLGMEVRRRSPRNLRQGVADLVEKAADRFCALILYGYLSSLRNGMGQYELKPPEGFTVTINELTFVPLHMPLSEEIAQRNFHRGIDFIIPNRTATHNPGTPSDPQLSQICLITPGPLIEARVTVCCLGRSMAGRTFHPRPNSDAGLTHRAWP